MGELLAHRRQRQHFLDLLMQALDHRTRRLGRGEDAVPEGVVGIGKARFERGWHIGQTHRAFAGIHRQRQQTTIADHRQAGGNADTHEVDPSGHHLGQRLRATTKRDMRHLHTSRQTQTLGSPMRGAADPGRGEGEIALAPGFDQIAQPADTLGRRNHRDVGHVAKHRNPGKVAGSVIRQLGIGRRCRGMG